MLFRRALFALVLLLPVSTWAAPPSSDGTEDSQRNVPSVPKTQQPPPTAPLPPLRDEDDEPLPPPPPPPPSPGATAPDPTQVAPVPIPEAPAEDPPAAPSTPEPKRPAPPKPPVESISDEESQADPLLQPIDEAPKPQSYWYGWQILIIDGLSTTLLLSSGGEGSAATLGAIGYLGGGPLVHGAHGHVGKALGSAGLRFGLPVAGILLGLKADWETAQTLAVVGVLAAVTIDTAVLAKKPMTKPTLPRSTVTPSASVTREGFSLGLTGSF